MKFLKISEKNPEHSQVAEVVECLKTGGIIIYPTDTLYAIGCDVTNNKALERIGKLKGFDPQKAQLAFVFDSLATIADYTLPFDRTIYKIMNKNLPGPFTFILRASNAVPKLLKASRKTLGVRVPNNGIAREIVRQLGNPIITTSLKLVDDPIEYLTDPNEIFHEFGKQVDMVIDGGYGNYIPSTVVDFSEGETNIVRQGAGELAF